MGALSKALVAAVFILFLLAPGVAFCKESGMAALVMPEKVYSLIKQGSGMWLVDVRSPVDYEKCHVQGAINIPLEELGFKSLPKEKLVVLVDDSLGNMKAEEAASLLISKGNKKVFILDGGLYGWERMGYPTAGSEPARWGLTARPVTSDELKAALKKGLPVRIYDIRGDIKGGGIPGSEAVAGADLNARLRNLFRMIKKSAGSGLASRLKGPMQVVLVFSARDDVAGAVSTLSLNGVADVRYLLGGYEAMNAVGGRMVSSNSAGCPVCPKSRQGRGR